MKLLNRLQKGRQKIGAAILGPQLLAFLPAVTLGSYWFGGEALLIFFALSFPAAFAVAGIFSGTGPAWGTARDSNTGMVLRQSAEKALDLALAAERETGETTAAIVLQIDDFEKNQKQFGTIASNKILKQTAERIVNTVRDADIVARLDNQRFAVILAPIHRVDIETMIQLSARLQTALADPYSIDATRIYLTASVGFCLPDQAIGKSGKSLLECAEIALDSARSYGAGSIRTYSRKLKRKAADQQTIREEIEEALELGQIRAWFQPQVSTHTGKITGFEALARWEHPSRGTILPRDFLPAIAEQNLQERLTELILSQSFQALKKWDKTNLTIPTVSVNFACSDLENPKIYDKIRWELDRYNLTPDRLCVEILEDVIAVSDNDIVVRNIAALAKMGCKIDLDDFGTGHASITNIRRFAVHRIKIDRSFITRVDRDREQQNMVTAILTMAERLKLDTLAEGVETVGEHAMLAQLGCGHVQGFSVARPMPFDQTEAWACKHLIKISDTPKVGKKAV
ncbi:MAG: putative bifunctional diguanylate cyclase/phosphodiesterase [Paracoccaceae bacterium]